MIKIGFIGLGGMGRLQATSFGKLADRCIVAAGADPNETSRAEFRKLFPQASVFSDHRDLLADASIDALVIAPPTAFHKEVAIDVIRAHRHILLEKPMGRTVTDCRAILDATQKSDRVLMVAHCRRFDTDWGTLADTYRAGILGEKVLWREIRASNWPRNSWFMDDALSGGPLLDGAIHNQDFANMLFGQADHVIGSSIKLDSSCTCIDTGTAVVQYESGSQLMLSWSWAVNGSATQDVLGTKGTFIFGPRDQTPPAEMGAHTLLDLFGKPKLLPFEKRNMYVTQAAHFLDCIEGKAECQSGPIDAMKAVAVGEAVLRACRENIKIKIERI
jgi:predicted dehydrogenase